MVQNCEKPGEKQLIRVACTASYPAEREYILDVLLREFLGLDYRIEYEERDDWRLTLDEQPGLPALHVPDVLFRTLPEQWLTAASLPREPVSFCSPSREPLPSTQDATGLPVLYGLPGRTHGAALEGGDLHLTIDVFGSSCFMLTRYEELVLPDRDTYGRFPGSASLAQRSGVLMRPIVNEYVELLWSALHQLWPQIERRPRQFRVRPTHDVDRPFGVHGRPVLAALRSVVGDLKLRRNPGLAWRRLGAIHRTRRGELAADPYWTFEQIMDCSEALGLTSTFYFLVDSARHSLELPEIVQLMRRIHERGHLVGVHPTLDSYRNPEAVLGAKRAVERSLELAAVAQEMLGGRQHFLQWACPETWQAYADAGLAHDSSLGFADAAGFRCGVCYDYPVFNLRTRSKLPLRECPLIVSEATLFHYEKQAPEMAMQRIAELKAQCRKYNGDFTMLWHNSELFDDRRWAMHRQAITP